MTAGFPERLAEWLDTFDDAVEFAPATPVQVERFSSGWERPAPESLTQLWLEFGSCRFDGEATLLGTSFVLHTIHGLDDTEHGIAATRQRQPVLERAGLIPVVDDAGGTEFGWSRRDGSVVAVRPDGRIEPLFESIEQLWDQVSVREWDTSQAAVSAAAEPDAVDEPEPLGQVTFAAVRHEFGHHLCIITDTDPGEVYQGSLDERGLGRTDSALSLATADREVTVTLATQAQAPAETPGVQLVWEGKRDAPTGEIGVMTTNGLILMYCPSPPRARIRLWVNEIPEPDRILVVVG
ncbi:hypothetical protein [Nakamurella aerolata]|uniref:Uncharacterized protein n=1 Tax=Nakamurella aerolata TaxID=1656892 RepID=A0A849AC64_9ACTN|nr:hypothetical protein [Nakamurella aerolata]NNG37186.1 hypothetical protein [Nakamurella aerolata]